MLRKRSVVDPKNGNFTIIFTRVYVFILEARLRLEVFRR
jgi:hypothetical protein